MMDIQGCTELIQLALIQYYDINHHGAKLLSGIDKISLFLTRRLQNVLQIAQLLTTKCDSVRLVWLLINMTIEISDEFKPREANLIDLITDIVQSYCRIRN